MRAIKLEHVFRVIVAAAGLFAAHGGTAAVTDVAAARAADTVAGLAHAADVGVVHNELDATRVTVPYRGAGPYREAGLRSDDARLMRFTPAPAAQAATVPQQIPRNSTKDLLLLTLVGGMLVAYQLLRKHRLLRQQPFSL